ncbi:MAG: plasmid mobilization relaxosome protein MobC [Lachnospiraceae bacterium]|nr:plasmid mobilization relaxosome protein MobC [Lachnospiraceae bacterium]
MANRKRPYQYIVRLSEPETWLLYDKVSQAGSSQQEYIRRCILGAQVINTDGLKQLLPELKRIGNNLNQIARSCNQGKQAAAEEVAAIRIEVCEICALLKQQLADILR